MTVLRCAAECNRDVAIGRTGGVRNLPGDWVSSTSWGPNIG